MPLQPDLAEDVLGVIQKYRDITPTQEANLKLAATLLAEDEMGWDELDRQGDPRLTVTGDDFDLIPGTIEVLHGRMTPKHWATPNRLARAKAETR